MIAIMYRTPSVFIQKKSNSPDFSKKICVDMSFIREVVDIPTF